MRTLLVLLFIGSVGAGAIYAAQRPTIAKGEFIGDRLLSANKAFIRSVHCDPSIPIGVDGARFWCRIVEKNGESQRLEFVMDRDGQITQAAAVPHKHVKRTSDPWGG